jgi:hypothetical protein
MYANEFSSFSLFSHEKHYQDGTQKKYLCLPVLSVVRFARIGMPAREQAKVRRKYLS